MFEGILKGKWNQLSGEAKRQWGKLSEDDVQEIAGDMQKLKGVIQERYGWKQEEAQKEVNRWLHKYSAISEEINARVIEGNWKKLTDIMKDRWTKFTEDDLASINGDYQKLVGILQKKYGYAKDEAKEKVADFLEDTSDKIRS